MSRILLPWTGLASFYTRLAVLHSNGSRGLSSTIEPLS